MDDLFEYLQLNLPGRVKRNEILAAHTTLKIGGPADLFVLAENQDDLRLLITEAAKRKIPLFILGNGSNLLISDRGIRGLVVKLTGEFKNIVLNGCEITAGAGAMLPVLAVRTAKAGLSGLELLAGIPGTVGGALVMNAGALGQCIGDAVQSVTVFDRTGQVKVLSREEMAFAYRRSILQERDYLIAAVKLSLSPGEREELQKNLQAAVAKRKRSQPLSMPNAGSIFRNPKEFAAGRLIEELGFKGFKQGQAAVSELHANFIVNEGGATAQDVLQLIKLIQARVQEKYHILLEPEIKVIGE